MSVYYVRSLADGMVKIGFAGDPFKRFSKIQSDTPNRLALAAIEEGDVTVECERHAQFAALRVRGEWFRDEGDLRAHIDGLPQFEKPSNKVASSGPLGLWIFQNNHTLASFAEVVGTTQATISRVCSGAQFPRRELMLAIVEATNWEVDANDLLGIPPKPRSAA